MVHQCPTCGGGNALPPNFEGTMLGCGHCGVLFALYPSANPSPHHPQAVSPSPVVLRQVGQLTPPPRPVVPQPSSPQIAPLQPWTETSRHTFGQPGQPVAPYASNSSASSFHQPPVPVPSSIGFQHPLADDIALHCPSCRGRMKPGAILCVECGYHTLRGERLKPPEEPKRLKRRKSGPGVVAGVDLTDPWLIPAMFLLGLVTQVLGVFDKPVMAVGLVSALIGLSILARLAVEEGDGFAGILGFLACGAGVVGRVSNRMGMELAPSVRHVLAGCLVVGLGSMVWVAYQHRKEAPWLYVMVFLGLSAGLPGGVVLFVKGPAG